MLPAQELRFAYRHAALPAQAVVISARLKLVPGDPGSSAALRAQLLGERKRSQPLTLPSAGSVFKNPAPDLSAGRLLDAAGMKGVSVGGAQISELHANWIVNPQRQASSADVCALIDLCRDRVQRHAGVVLEPELVRW